MSKFRYAQSESVPREVVFEQARYVAQLVACLHKLTRHLTRFLPSDVDWGSPKMSQRQASILRSQCLASLVYLSMVSNPHECGWDAYAGHFQQIIEDAQALIEPNSEDKLGQFSISLGILQPLFPCRDQISRPVMPTTSHNTAEQGWARRPISWSIARCSS